MITDFNEQIWIIYDVVTVLDGNDSVFSPSVFPQEESAPIRLILPWPIDDTAKEIRSISHTLFRKISLGWTMIFLNDNCALMTLNSLTYLIKISPTQTYESERPSNHKMLTPCIIIVQFLSALRTLDRTLWALSAYFQHYEQHTARQNVLV